ncbi:polysaccharide pyruvyl transferase family protein [Haloarcula argentinensis]|uniref:Polysaccharide pyruvyl transferase domain-containing protein n=1 Tax=Haloarcula argentinensis TaxID=43776 RepID=A0A847UJI9_HALAR|nr:polysaccharide pyruvyl transferase family protein [Haloarcula argentinensis]NLV12636.1 hypothetical protein [Haloarcula argentinensis]
MGEVIPEITELEKLLEQYSDEKFTLIEPGGNHGDQMIYAGLQKKAEEKEITYDSVNRLKSLRNSKITKAKRGLNLLSESIGGAKIKTLELNNPDAIYIHGGGNFSDLWGSSMATFKNITQTYPKTPIIVGPQTYWFSETDFTKLVADCKQEIHLFCREAYSYALLTNHDVPENISIHKSPDTAFYLDKGSLLKYVNKDSVSEPAGEYDLIAFRNDRESVVSQTEIRKLEASADNTISKDISDKYSTSFPEFISTVEYANTVYTDRLHVSVLSTILGTNVELYENSYYKNRGVYKYSMSDMKKTRFNDAV